ncbi:MAG: sulfate ABC transporter permease subunit CysT [Parvibaculaceae bacterium]
MLRRKKSALPGLGLTLGTTGVYLALIVLLPVAALLMKAASLTPSEFFAIISSPRALASFRVTLSAAFYATIFNGIFGLLLAWVLVRYEFPGRRLLDALVDLPFALPTAVAGIALTALFARNGMLGQYLEPLGLKIAYAPAGIALAMAFTSLPFVVRSVQPVLEDIDIATEEAGRSLGASDLVIFLRVIFPAILPAFLAGCTLGFARSLGEFGAVIFIAGNIPMQTEITALLIFIRLEEFDYQAAAAYATVLLVMAFALMFATNLIQMWQLRYSRKADA